MASDSIKGKSRAERNRMRFFFTASKLLDRAEEIQKTVRTFEEQRSRLMLLLLSVLNAVLFVVAMYFSIIRPPLETPATLVLLGSALFCVATCVTFFAKQILRIKYEIAREKRTMYRIVDMLREVAGVMGNTHSSPIQEAELKIRLAQFDIGRGETVQSKELNGLPSVDTFMFPPHRSTGPISPDRPPSAALPGPA